MKDTIDVNRIEQKAEKALEKLENETGQVRVPSANEMNESKPPALKDETRPGAKKPEDSAPPQIESKPVATDPSVNLKPEKKQAKVPDDKYQPKKDAKDKTPEGGYDSSVMNAEKAFSELDTQK